METLRAPHTKFCIQAFSLLSSRKKKSFQAMENLSLFASMITDEEKKNSLENKGREQNGKFFIFLFAILWKNDFSDDTETLLCNFFDDFFLKKGFNKER